MNNIATVEKFTPGPWLIRESDDCHVDIIKGTAGGDWKWIVSVLGSHVRNTAEEMEANAKLIAAAPDLYEAIKSALQIKDLWSAQQYGTVSADAEGELQALGEMEEKLKAAINKATE